MFSCKKDSNSTDVVKTADVSDIIPSLNTPDHTSEGFLASFSNGTIIHIFRLDSGINGSHIGNTGRISKRISNDYGKTWTAPVTIYDDGFDDRNVRGGLTDDGKLIVFFRRFNATNLSPVDLNYIISTDLGITWSAKKQIDISNFPLYTTESWVDNFVKLSANEYLLPIHGLGYCEFRKFSTGNTDINFLPFKSIIDTTVSKLIGIDEPYCCKNSDNKLICLFRDESSSTSRINYYQSVSSDLGVTWSIPVRTKIGAPFFCPSPLIFYDSSIANNTFVIATDRRISDDYNSKVWIYNDSFDNFFNMTNKDNLILNINRPKPSSYMFYGYPIFTKMKNNKYLVIITESMFDGVNEDADFYQFEISSIK
jgi:hypothetical protein